MTKIINRSVVFLLLLCINAYSQINPDSLSINYYPSGKKLEETGFYLKKKLYNKTYYEDGTTKEKRRFDKKTGKKIIEYRYISKETGLTINVEYRRNENPKEEVQYEQDGTVITEKIYDRKGRLRIETVLIDKEKQLRLEHKYNRHGQIKKVRHYQ